MTPTRVLAAAALGAALIGCGGPDCTFVRPAAALAVTGRLVAGGSEPGLSSQKLRHGLSSGTVFAVVGGPLNPMRIVLPPGHCAGQVSFEAAQVVGPSESAGDLRLALLSGASTDGVELGAYEMTAGDTSTPQEGFSEDQDVALLGPSIQRHTVTFSLPVGIDVVTLVRTTEAIHEVAIARGSFVTDLVEN